MVANRSYQTFGSPVALMRFHQIDGLEVRDNSNPIATEQSRLGVLVEQSCDVVVVDNHFPGRTPPGKGPAGAIVEAHVINGACE